MGWQQSPTNGWDKSPRWGRLGWEGRASSISVRLVSVGAVRAGATCKRSRSGWHTGGNSAFSAPCFLPVLPPRASLPCFLPVLPSRASSPCVSFAAHSTLRVWRFRPPNAGRFSPIPSNSLCHQPGVLQFNSIPMPSVWR